MLLPARGCIRKDEGVGGSQRMYTKRSQILRIQLTDRSEFSTLIYPPPFLGSEKKDYDVRVMGGAGSLLIEIKGAEPLYR